MAELIVTALSATTPARTASGKRGKAKYTIADGVAQQVHDAADELLGNFPLYPGLEL